MQIDIYHDTVCPWCRIGKQNLKIALADWQGEPVTINYHTFFLNEGLPPEGAEFRSYMTSKMGGRYTLETLFERPTSAGAAVGLHFNFEAITRAPNTLLSHALIAIAPDDQREATIDALYRAYFEDGLDIGQPDILVQVGRQVGIDEALIQQALSDQTLADELLAEARNAQRMGITGVPFFIINQKQAFSGAQPPELIRKVLHQAAAASK